MVSFNLTIGAVEPHYLAQCLDPADDLGGSSSIQNYHSEIIAIDEVIGPLASLPNGKEIWMLSDSRTGHACSHLGVPMAHQTGLSRLSLAGDGLFESVRHHGPGLARLTYGGVQQQQLCER
ncbi:hypothetical protein TNCV_4673681 [Trichonephila clavipes]|nr:hypothetical protein TNCV_4673681 [Trichonephila clavipes]